MHEKCRALYGGANAAVYGIVNLKPPLPLPPPLPLSLKYYQIVAVNAYLSPRLRERHSAFSGRLWNEFILDSDTRAAEDFDARWVALIRTEVPDYNLPTASDPEADSAAAIAAAEAVAILLGEAPPPADGAGPSSAAPAAEPSALRSYFNTLWHSRAKWAGVYVRSSLILTVLTSGRSESWHNVLKRELGYNGNTSLENLIANNNRALDNHLAESEGRDPLLVKYGRSMSSNLLVSGARTALSPYAAAFIAREVDKAQLYTVQLPGVQDGNLIRYTVLRPAISDLGEEGPTCTEVCRLNRIVTVTTGADGVALSIECSCQTQTSVGLACRHADAVATVRQEAKSFHSYMAHEHWDRDGPSPEDLIVALQARALPPPREADGGGSRRRLEPEVNIFYSI